MTEQGTERTGPSVVVDDLHVSYRTYGGRRTTEPGSGRRFTLRRHVAAVDRVHAVTGVSFVAHHGESIGVIGHNGSGKSTLLRAVAGLVPPSSGGVYAAGTPSLLGVGGVLVKELSGERNIVLGSLALGLSPTEVRERFDAIVDFAGIGDFVQLPMSAYSSGMSARLRFAISTATSPDVLLVDEALATGDAEFKQRSRERIREIVGNAGTVLLVSHSMSTIQQTCDRVLWMDRGVLRMDGPTDEVVAAYSESVAQPDQERR
ncbi:ABC transporter ATP-binding protein [Nocardioides guangzhouensis]|uniref:ABC transporter ATP-binding protein n=1 Tax=Nocardioides guangzhouensis TaxID=2497878 RepID=UPI001FEC4FE0|nr:ABC transporter ATP-binding protein [Nocardioides guangzhouensis]